MRGLGNQVYRAKKLAEDSTENNRAEIFLTLLGGQSAWASAHYLADLQPFLHIIDLSVGKEECGMK